MAGWTVRTDGGDAGPFTIYQLQERLRSGRLGADDLVRADAGEFRRVADVPQLARWLGDGPPAGSIAGAGSGSRDRRTDEAGVLVHGVVLRKGPDGKPLPPSPAELAQLLRQAEPRTEWKSVKAGVLVFAVVFAIAAGVFASVIVKMLSSSTSVPLP